MFSRLLKRLTRSRAFRAALPWLAARYIGLVRITSLWRALRPEIPRDFWSRGEPFILAFWHGRMLMIAPAWPRGRKMNMLISHHRDGELIARTMDWLHIGTVRGSSTKGGTEALRAMVRALARGECAGITPDGPGGPAMAASPGVVALARLSGAAIVPVSFSARRARALSSWDRFLVALPFTRGLWAWGEPIRVDRHADEAAMEAARLLVEQRLNALQDEVDALCGHPPIRPAAA